MFLSKNCGIMGKVNLVCLLIDQNEASSLVSYKKHDGIHHPSP